LPHERLDLLRVPVLLRDDGVVLERLVRGEQRVGKLVALEDIVVASRLVAAPVLRVDRPPGGPGRGPVRAGGPPARRPRARLGAARSRSRSAPPLPCRPPRAPHARQSGRTTAFSQSELYAQLGSNRWRAGSENSCATRSRFSSRGHRKKTGLRRT